ncbi:hypothetical protein CANARDRAFT_201228 [[Candida] arabinofermentans NRRL YB-2248]|uniref:Patatin-like phospholipase domain-containing protein n=1 Tax=[Candida] arabinofermentans NRRL YB-2248 TaxID=983967 RepID=A0A1E4SXZ1_9ASCO|nr:hypothetical protein CANARDRAFT_201228 [[Candida] arabinofermentans NRRL YB-2248]
MTEASDSLPPSFASDSNPPPASSTPFEVIFNPRLKRTSTTNYRTELEAQQQKAEDDARSQLTRRESEKNTFDKMSAQNFKRQLSFTKPDDDSKIEAPIETIYTRDSSAIDEGKEKHSLLGDIKNKLHIGSPHSLHSHHQKHETDQSEQTKLSKYEFGLNVSDQLNSSNSSSISISDVSPNESTSYTQPHAKRKNKKKNRLKDKQFLLPDDNSLTFKVLRYPFLIFIAMWLTVLSIVYLIVRLSIYISEQVMANTGQRRKMVNKLKNSKSYPEYIEHAKALNEYLKLDKWCEEDRFYCYDWKTLRRIVRDLRKLRRAGKNQELMIVLQNCVKSNFAGSENPLLYSHTYYGTKNLIVEYNNEVVTSLNSITESTSIPIETKKNFFKTISRSFGKTALALSGGASFCYNHYGVLKALLDNDLLPNIISGTSGGGVISALATTRTNKELASLITPKLAKKINAAGNEPFHVWFRRWWKTGARFDSLDWARKSQWWTLGSMTFKECYERTGKILNISTVPHDIHSPTILCNYITAPDCCIWSTLLASAAVPGILNPVVLMEKVHNGPDGKECIKPFSFGSKWKDGSLRTDIPIEALNTYFNVKFSIVSQVNPHVLLWFFNNKGDIGKPVNRSKGKGYRGGFLSSYLENLIKLESIKWLKLIKEFQLLPNFLESDWSNVFLQKFSGTITLFPKVKIWDYFRLLDDPSEERVAEYITNGQSVTYPKILFIKHRLNIERCIEQGRKSCQNDSYEVDDEDDEDDDDEDDDDEDVGLINSDGTLRHRSI